MSSTVSFLCGAPLPPIAAASAACGSSDGELGGFLRLAAVENCASSCLVSRCTLSSLWSCHSVCGRSDGGSVDQ